MSAFADTFWGTIDTLKSQRFSMYPPYDMWMFVYSFWNGAYEVHHNGELITIASSGTLFVWEEKAI